MDRGVFVGAVLICASFLIAVLLNQTPPEPTSVNKPPANRAQAVAPSVAESPVAQRNERLSAAPGPVCSKDRESPASDEAQRRRSAEVEQPLPRNGSSCR